MSGPQVSVVIPTYNCRESLREALDSALAQDGFDLEVVVVDDGSTDGTVEQLAGVADPRVRVFLQSNAGPAAARNRGIEEASGEWIAFLDADDLWLPEKLSHQFSALAKHPGARFSYTGVRVLHRSGHVRETRGHHSDGALLSALLLGNQFATPTALVHRDCFEQVGLFDPNLRTGEDWDMWLRLAVRYQSCAVPDALALVRVGENAPKKYPVDMLERCTLRVLEGLFSNPAFIDGWPALAARRQDVYAWHCSVLAKSHLRHKRPADFCRLAARAVFSHPNGLRYLSPRRWDSSRMD